MDKMKIAVIGSSNMDMVVQVDHLPLPGETVSEARFAQTFGGKGANQAVAATRLGGDVTFITTLGRDMNGEMMRKQFSKEGMKTDYILEDLTNPTGIALIFVEADSGQNCIAVAPGANHSLTPDRLPSFAQAIKEADIVMMQAEIPYRTIADIASYASQIGKRIIYNPAPASKIDPELLSTINILVMNEIEASVVSGIEYEEGKLSMIADRLLKLGVGNVVITLGRDGVYMKNNCEEIRLPSFTVEAVDTVAAGDTFCGALAVKCTGDNVDRNALIFATAASAISVTRHGAQPSIPTSSEVENFLERNINTN